MGAAVLVLALSSVPNTANEIRYFYDDLGRLVRVERAEGVVVTYTYDAIGNRLSRTIIHDADFDDSADAIDNCPLDYNPGQEDADTDFVGDVCDNCPAMSNNDQADGDSDMAGDVCSLRDVRR